MLNRIIDRMIAREEVKSGARLGYLRQIAGESESAFWKLAMVLPLARHRQILPKTAYHLASVVATQEEDRGECLESVVQQATHDETPAHYIRAALGGNFHLLPLPLEEVCVFARGMAQGIEQPQVRHSLQQRYGAKGMVELSFAISSARFFVTLKRSMGGAMAHRKERCGPGDRDEQKYALPS